MASASALADTVAAYLDIDAGQKQEILETVALEQRLDKVSGLLAHRLEVLRLSAEIGRDVQEKLGSRQREVLLREQMAAKQRQLGEDDGQSAEIAELTEKIDKTGIPEEVESQARKELRRLERMQENAAEHGIIRTYLDWLTELPWSLPEETPIDIAAARAILDADHYGLEKIKRRIVEYLAVRKLAPEGKAPILCFVGPPGVGKTSLGQSIAKAMGRPFVRDVGGARSGTEQQLPR
jgi:ATP-dependent Lon protease